MAIGNFCVVLWVFFRMDFWVCGNYFDFGEFFRVGRKEEIKE